LFCLPWDEPQFRLNDEPFFRLHSILLIIDTFIGAARGDNDFLTIILEANILGLLRPFLQQEFQNIPPFMAQHSGDRLMVYDSADFELLATIREHGLKQLLPRFAGGDIYSIDLRRDILSRALDTVLRGTRNRSDTSSSCDVEMTG
jgi:hypothetical protein